MRDDTGIGGARGRFPTTRLSAVEAAGSSDPGERDHGFAAVVAASHSRSRRSPHLWVSTTNFEIMLPGAIVGAIVDMRHRSAEAPFP